MTGRFANLDEFERFAEEFASELRAGDVVALAGPLGAGKTTFVRAVVRALHHDDEATSPTFTFWHRYVKSGTMPIDHLDLYRIENPAELAELGLEEAFSDDAIVFVEWWEHAPQLLPEHRIELWIEGSGDAPRTVRVERR